MKSIFLVLCIACGISLQAQQFKIDFSSPGSRKNEVTTVHRYGKNLFSNETDWGKMQFAFTANLKKVKYGIKLTQYDEQLNELKVLSLDNGEKSFGPFAPIVHYGKTSINVLYYKYGDDDKIRMYVSKINPTDLSVVATKEIMEYNQENQGMWGTFNTIEDSQTFYTVSEDGQQAWLIHATPKLIFSSVIDGDLNLVQKTVSVPVNLERLRITGTHIGNDGNKVLVYHYRDPGNKEFDTRGVFFQPPNEKGSFQTIKFTNGYFPGDLELKQSKDGKKLYLGGDYFGEEYDDGSKGVLLGEINMKSQAISTPVFFPYTEELKQRIVDLDFARRKKGEVVIMDRHLNYNIDEMENGTIVLSAELFFVNDVSVERTVTFRGPVVLIFIKSNGNSSMTLIPKKQPPGPVTSFFTHVYKDKLVCIYADLPKFQEKEFTDKQIGRAGGVNDLVPVANVYDSVGKLLSRKMLIPDTKDIKGNIMLGYRSKIADNKFMFPVGAMKANMVKYYMSVNQVFYLEIF